MKKTLLVLPVLLLVFAAGCGQSNQSSNSQKESVKTSQTSHKTKKASAKSLMGRLAQVKVPRNRVVRLLLQLPVRLGKKLQQRPRVVQRQMTRDWQH